MDRRGEKTAGNLRTEAAVFYEDDCKEQDVWDGTIKMSLAILPGIYPERIDKYFDFKKWGSKSFKAYRGGLCQ